MEKTVVKMERKEKRAVLNRVKGCAAIILYSWCFGSSVFLYFLLLLLLHTCTPFIKTLNRRRLGLNFFFIVWGPFLIPPHNNLSSRILIRSLSFHALETGTYIPFRGSVELRKKKKDFPSGSDDQKKRGKEGGAVRRERRISRKKSARALIMSYSRLTNDGGLSPLREDISTQANRVQSLIFQLQTNVSTFKRLVDQLGTARDTKEQRAKLHKLRESIGQMAKESSVLVKKLAKMVTDLVHEEQDHEYDYEGGEDEDDAESLAERHKKLVKDLHATLKDFQRAQRACAERESTFLPQKENVGSPKQAKSGKKKGYGATGGNNNGADVALSGERGGQFYQASQMVDEEQQHAPLLMEHKSQGQKEMTAVEIDMRFNDQLIEERERGIAEIQQQIGEVNEIFQDLAVLVNEQGNMIDDIEANIVSTAVRTKEAQKELTKADKSQKSARNKMVCLAITVFTALIILILFLLQ